MLVHFRMSSSRIIQFSGNDSSYIDKEQLKRIVKLSPLSHSATGYEDVFRALDQAGVEPKDIKGLYKVSVTDLSYLLYLSNDTQNVILAFSNNVNVILAPLHHFLLSSSKFGVFAVISCYLHFYLQKGGIPKHVIERKLLC